jgi:hypothetical protein
MLIIRKNLNLICLDMLEKKIFFMVLFLWNTKNN